MQSLHGDMSQAAREAVLQRFRDGRVMCLIATDVAARGLDIANVDLVVHYELPKDHESFLHRCAPARHRHSAQQGVCCAGQCALLCNSKSRCRCKQQRKYQQQQQQQQQQQYDGCVERCQGSKTSA